MGTRGREIVGIDVDKVIEMLNAAYASEWLAYYQYWLGAKLIKGPMKDAVAAELTLHATEELNHAVMLAGRIIQLGGTLLLDPHEWFDKSPCAHDAPKDAYVSVLLDENIAGEQCAIDTYKKLMDATKDKDMVTCQHGADDPRAGGRARGGPPEPQGRPDPLHPRQQVARALLRSARPDAPSLLPPPNRGRPARGSLQARRDKGTLPRGGRPGARRARGDPPRGLEGLYGGGGRADGGLAGDVRADRSPTPAGASPRRSSRGSSSGSRGGRSRMLRNAPSRQPASPARSDERSPRTRPPPDAGRGAAAPLRGARWPAPRQARRPDRPRAGREQDPKAGVPRRATGARTLVTAGAFQSNHCRQTAAAAARRAWGASSS